MYIKLQDDEYVLVRSFPGSDGPPREVVLARLGQDPELNLFVTARQGRLEAPELWEGVHDYHLLQALENFKRRIGGFKPALVAVKGGKPFPGNEDSEAESQ
jgi:hypothetical protein